MSALATKCYRELSNDFPRPVGFIANVLLTGCGRPGKRLEKLLQRVKAGHEVDTIPFVMPYEGFLMDGVAVRMEILDAPVEAPVESFRLVGK